jgi:hypothetical protein
LDGTTRSKLANRNTMMKKRSGQVSEASVSGTAVGLLLHHESYFKLIERQRHFPPSVARRSFVAGDSTCESSNFVFVGISTPGVERNLALACASIAFSWDLPLEVGSITTNAVDAHL